MVKKNKGEIIPSGNFPAQALCGTPCGKKSRLSFLTFRLFVSLTTGNIYKKAGKKASQKAQLYLRDAPPPTLRAISISVFMQIYHIQSKETEKGNYLQQ